MKGLAKMEIIKQLKEKGIIFEDGLTVNEISKIENIYGIHIPKNLEKLYMACMPISNGFYNWRDFSQENINFIKETMIAPFESVILDTEDIEWCETWGSEPIDSLEREKIIKQKLNMAPKLIPLYIHRYIISTEKEDAPIFSIHGTDIICYGENLQKYLEIEFLGKSYNEANFDKISEIPFWGEIL